MIILDTNVVSEIVKPEPSREVMYWLQQQPISLLYITAITQAELYFGIELLPQGKRRTNVKNLVEGLFRDDFINPILPFDTDAARAYAGIMSNRRALGKPIQELDAQIAAIASSQRATLVTRNLKDFEDCGVIVLNPWKPDTIH